MKNFTQIILFLCLISTGSLSFGQDSTALTISGTVRDEQGKPVLGASIETSEGEMATTTDGDGKFALVVAEAMEKIIVSQPGFRTQSIIPEGANALEIRLENDVFQRDLPISLGYSTQRGEEITGAISTVSGRILQRSPVANLSQTLPGRMAGLTTQETFSELSRAGTELFVRGLSAARINGPLVIIDGIMTSYLSSQSLEYITPNEIESFTILKDASTQALYGIQGANGIIVITTKRGIKGGLQIRGRFDQSFQQVTTKPLVYSSGEYAQMRNQAAENDGFGPNYLFSRRQLEGFQSGSNPELYPNNNWYKYYMKDWAQMRRLNVDLSGGTERVQYYANLNAMHQGGYFNTDQVRYNPDANNIWLNYRSNVDMQLNNYIKAFVRLSGNIKRERTPGVSNSAIYGSIFELPPTMYGPITQGDPADSVDNATPGGKVITTERVAAPTFGMLNRTGYFRHTVTNIYSQFGLDVDLDFLTKGLSLTGTLAYQTNAVGSLSTTQNFERWVRTADSTTLAFTKKGSETDSPLAYGKGSSFYYHLTYNFLMNYQRSFGKNHVSALGYMFYQNLIRADNTSPELLPYNRISSGTEVAYNFDHRYLIKADLGYSGSEQYARAQRFSFTPAISLGWVLSNEEFLRQNKFLSFLKLRGSFGRTANDQSGLLRFAYLDNITVGGGGPIASLQYLINEMQTASPNIRPEYSTKGNVGLDLGLFNALSLSLDVFNDRMDNMVVSAANNVPLYQGIPLANYPQTNTGAFKNQGYELTANFSKNLSRRLSFSVGGMLSYAKNTVVKTGEALKNETFAYRKWQEGFPLGQQFGYLVDHSNGNGFFNTQEELDNSAIIYSFGTPRLGDLKYRDLNNDGTLDERDKAPIGSGAIPQYVYAFTGGLSFGAFELNVLFQGIGKYATIYAGTGVFETDFDGIFGSLHQSAWTAERYQNQEEITYPALSLARTVNHEGNDFFNYDRAYLRLKNLELVYNLPSVVAKRISANSLRVILSGQNLITWDNMKSTDFGPEGGGYRSFPVYRVFNVGLSVGF